MLKELELSVESEEFRSHSLTSVEEKVDGDLARLMKTVRLANPYKFNTNEYFIWHEQSQYNIPALILAAKELPYQNVCFVHRDCIHLQRIHKVIYKISNPAFHCSRIALRHYDSEWIEYVRKKALGRLIVDLHGSGFSLSQFWKNAFNKKPDILLVTGRKRGVVRGCKSLIYTNHSLIERYNSSPLGSVLRWPQRAKCEHDPSFIDAEHRAVNAALKILPYFSSIQGDIEKLEFLIGNMQMGIVQKICNFKSRHDQ